MLLLDLNNTEDGSSDLIVYLNGHLRNVQELDFYINPFKTKNVTLMYFSCTLTQT